MMLMPSRVNGRNKPSSQNDEHGRDAKFQSFGEPFGNRDTQSEHNKTGNRQSDSVSSAPEQSYGAGPPKLPLPADECAHGHDVIRIRRMFQTEKEPEAQHRSI